MDNRLLIVKAITLAYRESTLKSDRGSSKQLIRDAITITEKPTDEVANMDFRGADPLVELRSTLNRMLSHNGDEPQDKNELLQRLLVNCDGDDVLFRALEEGIKPDMSEQETSVYCRVQREAIKQYVDETRALEFIKTAYHMGRFGRGNYNVGDIINEMMAKLEPYRKLGSTEISKTRGFSEVDIFDEGAMTDIFNNVRKSTTGNSGLQTGMQGLNDLAGATRKFSLGETILTPGSSFSFKTGTAKAIIRQLAMHNDPVMRDPTKTPLLVLWSVENENHATLKDMHKACWFLEFRDELQLDSKDDGEILDIYLRHIENIPDDVMGAYVRHHLGRRGYHVKFVRSNPADTDFMTIMSAVDDWKAQGFEIHAFVLDYMEKLSTRGCAQGVAGSDIKDLLSRLRNFFAVENILFWTPHQLNGEARLRRDNGEKNWIQKMGGSGTHYARCKDLYQEIDIEIVVNVFMHNTRKFLEYYLGKNRNNPDVPEGRKHVTYPLCPFTGLRDDIGRDDSKVKKLVNNTIGGMATAW